MIRKLLFLSCLLSVGFLSTIQAQTPQIHNIGFENWTDLGTSDEEPTSWNSFMSADGTWSFAAAQQVKRSTMKRPGSAGTYSAVIWCRNASGTMANGNLTTGRIRMGSTTPSSTNNYNRSVVSDTLFNEAFNGLPDSLVVWVRPKNSNTTHQPRIHAIIHDSYDVRDPLDAGSTSHVVGDAVLNWIPVNNVWVRKSIPFTYPGPATTPVYVLVSMTTCKDPGVGTAGDSLYIDDLQFIYNPPIATIANTPACGTGTVTVSSSKSGTQTYDLCDNGGAVLQTWTGNATSHAFTGLASGTYRGKVTLGTLVSALSSPTVLTNSIVPIATVSNTPACGTTGTVTVNSDQSGSQTFDLCDNGGAVLQTWTGSATSHAFTGLANGTYKGKVTLGTCVSILSGATTLTNNAIPVATVANTPACGTGTVTVYSDQSGSQTFDLCDNGGSVLQTWTGSATSHAFTGLANGTYKGKVTLGTCISTLSGATTLTNNIIPAATVSNTPDCSTGSVSVNSDQSGSQTFDLCDNGGAILQTWTGSATSHAFTGLANGIYKGKVTLGTCVSSLTGATTLTNNVIPVATVSNTAGCGVGSVTVTSNQSGTQTFELCNTGGSMLYTWTGNATSHIFAAADGVYTGRVTLGSCVSTLSGTTTLVNDIEPNATISSTAGCGSGTVTVTSDQSGYQTFNLCNTVGTVLQSWSGTGSSHTFTNIADGTYTGSLVSASCTSDISATTTLTNTQLPVATVSNTPDCVTGSVTVTSDQNTNQTFELCDIGGTMIQTWTGSSVSHSFTGLADGSYTGKVTINSCTSALSSVTSLTNNVRPIANISNAPGCDTGAITIYSDQSGNQVYELFDGLGNMLQTWIGTASLHTFTGLASGDYKGRTTLNGCTANYSAISTLTNDVMPVASVSSISGCGSGSVTVTSDQSGLQTFNLCDGTGNILAFWTGTVNSHTFTNQANGTYTGKVVSGSCISALSTTTTLTNTPGPTATIAVIPACDLGEVTVTSDQNTNQTFDLCNNAGTVLQTWTGNVQSFTFTGIIDGTYKGKVTVAGCESPFSSTEVLVNNVTPNVSLQPADTLVCNGLNGEFSFTDNGAASAYQWMVNAGGTWTNISSAGTNPVYSGWNSNTLSVSGVVMANDGLFYRCLLSNGSCTTLSDSAELMVDLCTGIADNNSENLFSVGPVPFNNALNIITPSTDKVIFQLFSAEGKLTQQTELNGKTSYNINTEALSNGIFIVKLTSDKETATFRVIKNN